MAKNRWRKKKLKIQTIELDREMVRQGARSQGLQRKNGRWRGQRGREGPRESTMVDRGGVVDCGGGWWWRGVVVVVACGREKRDKVKSFLRL